MVTSFKGTLWDAVKGHETEVSEAIHAAVVKAADDLGDAVNQLDWHNVVASTNCGQEPKAA